MSGVATPGDEAGWYDDPRRPGRRRYWDGEAWTGLTSASQSPTGVENDAEEGSAVRRPSRRKRAQIRRRRIAVAVVISVALIGGAAAVFFSARGDGSSADDHPCRMQSTRLLEQLRDDPNIEPLLAGASVGALRCADRWGGTTVTSDAAGKLFVVLERSGEGWDVVAVGVNDPCATLALPDGVDDKIGCVSA